MERNNMRTMFSTDRNQNSLSSGPQKRPHVPPNISHHDELVKFVQDSWYKVNEQGRQAPTMYQNPADTRLPGFKPFDLENYWGRRALQNYHMNRSHQ